jgi:ATP-dependent Clp protease ATP-binding subunit ClpC
LKDHEFLERELKKSKKSPSQEKMKEDTTSVANNLKGAVLDRLSTLFLPEFLNRLDDIIIFQPLKPEELRKICDIMVKEVSKRVATKQITLFVDDKVKAKLSREGYNPLFGARPLRRLITKYIEDLISENMLKNPMTNNAKRIVRIILNSDDQIVIRPD